MRIATIICALFFALVMLTEPTSTPAQVSVGITVGFAPPDLPVYEQPICPGDGYIWTPGYWAWDDDDGDYYWVPGTWVLAPDPGFLWTPAYWGWGGSAFVFYPGYWSFGVVGFYGGIDYGYGYFGHGYEGGRWDGDRFFYNRSVNNVNITEIHNVYNTTIVNDYRGPRVSYNGGNGGVEARPTPNEERVARARRLPPVAAQTQPVEAARSNPSLRVSQNHGKPPVAATPRPAAFNDRGVVQAQEGGRYTPAARQENTGGRPAAHPNDLPPVPRPTPANTGDPNRDRKYQQQQQKTYAKQDQERQRLQQQQDQEHQRMQQRQTSDAERQQ